MGRSGAIAWLAVVLLGTAMAAEPPNPAPAGVQSPAAESAPGAVPVVTSVAPPETAPHPAADSLLAACWDPADLRARPGEERIARLRPADHSPPARLDAHWSSPPLGRALARSIRSVTPANGEPLVALTFDLCEQADERAGYDGALVDLLRDQDVHATFYAGGKWLRSHPERAMQLMADRRFELGNHAWTHGNLRVLTGTGMEDQIHWTQAQYALVREELLARPCARAVPAAAAAIPALPATFRFPYGTCNTASLAAVAAAGLYPVQWSIVTGDPDKGQSAERIIHAVLGALRPGAIIVAHGNGRGWHTAEALRTLIPAIRARGYRFVTVSELLRSGTPVTAEQCYEVKPGDNLRYDRLFGKGTH
jgi:peptidoglycan-N-acetylglucosamine deacetylase